MWSTQVRPTYYSSSKMTKTKLSDSYPQKIAASRGSFPIPVEIGPTFKLQDILSSRLEFNLT
jgi:hypothetical protein